MANIVGWSAGLFIAGGAVWMLIGALTPMMMNTEAGRGTLLFSSAADSKTFGAPPRQVVDNEPNVDKLRTVLLHVVGGFLVVAGLLVISVSWFAWRGGQPWAYWTLTSASLLVLPFWFLAARPFIEAGAAIAFLDIPPFMWVPTALWIPAIVVGGWALRG